MAGGVESISTMEACLELLLLLGGWDEMSFMSLCGVGFLCGACSFKGVYRVVDHSLCNITQIFRHRGNDAMS